MSRLAKTVDDFCTGIGIGRTHAYALAKAGKLKIRKVGRRSVVLEEDERAFLQALPAIGQKAAPRRGRRR